MFFKRFASFIICVSMLFSVCSGALAENREMAILPASLKEIRVEAFMNDTSIRSVAVPEGTEKIESRAFAYSGLEEISLPSTLTYIAEDAFEGCEGVKVSVLRGTYAHKWAAFADVECVLRDEAGEGGDEEKVFRITGLSVVTVTDESGVETVCLSVGVVAGEDCILQAKVLSDEKEEQVLTENVAAGTDAEYFRLPVEKALPEYYILEAVLTDAQGNILSNLVRDISRSRAYVAAGSAAREDYAQDRVVELDKAGFAVLEEGVKVVSGTAADLGNDVYTVAMGSITARSGDGLPKAGDVLMLNVGGVQKPVKVGAVSILEDGTLRIEGSKDISLSDVYSKIELDGYMQTNGINSEAEGTALFNYADTFEKGNLTIDLDASMKLRVLARYDKKLLGEDFFEISLESSTWGNGIATLAGEFSTDDLEEPIEIELFRKVIPIGYVPTQIRVTLPLDVQADAKGTFELYFDKSAGFRWDTKNGYTKTETPWVNHAEAKIEADFAAETGPNLAFGIDVMGFVGAWLYGQVGVKLTGDLLAQQHFGTPEIPEEDKTHACNLCVGMDACLFGEMGANLDYNITEELKGNKSWEILRVDSEKFMDLYYSIINEKESVHKGEKVFALGECPNYKYKIDFAAEDVDGNAVNGLRVDVTDRNTQDFYGLTPYSLYMYKGSYTAGADFELGHFDENFVVTDQAEKVTVKERGMSISGVVSDNDSGAPLNGVKVTLTMPDGKTRTATTDKKGAYAFEKLPGGVYSLSFEKTGYSTRTVEAMAYAAGQNHSVNVGMKGPLPYIKARLQWPGSAQYVTAYAKTIDGSDMPWEIALIPGEGNGHTGLESFSLKYREDKPVYEFIHSEDDRLWLTIELTAADMGDGTYTYGIIFYSDTNNVCEVYREKGDTLEKVLDFTFTGKTDSVYGADGVHDGFLDYTKAEPSDGPGGIRETYASFTENDVGSYDLKISVEEVDYSKGYMKLLDDVITLYRLVGNELVIVDQYTV